MENRFGNRFGNRASMVPVKVGEEFDVIIEAVGEKGDGIAKKDGFVLFVPNTQENQNVKIRVTKVLRRVGFAEVVGEGSSHVDRDESVPEDEPASVVEGTSAVQEEAPVVQEQVVPVEQDDSVVQDLPAEGDAPISEPEPELSEEDEPASVVEEEKKEE